MARNGLAIDFAHELGDGQFPIIPDRIAEAFGTLTRHVAVASCPRPSAVITQELPNPGAAWALAGINAAYAAVLIWSALGLTARTALLRLSRPLPLLNLSIAAYALILTALLIWR